MKVIETLNDSAVLACSKDELLIFHSALNEICNGIDLFEFETRIGAGRGVVNDLLLEVSLILDGLEQS
ncbi:MAG TPA: hypothetical protein ENH72_12645 [Pseudomonas sabulinigri]|uniref:Uncharacterized protein n=1 Tax=marine sediment metagenome TaxID=412755 RepID=A0A0F9VT00_9ZZZZ|nr:hypothetical protein [Halopseudomonas sabulinigri]HEC51758.1 hypothetical protein [Halopseudomonas sabulinigri]